MEARKILFVMNNSSSQKSIMSEAETLGALKADMRRAGINYDNMTFYEGRTRTELKDDASVLPTNVPVAAKGTTPATTTNDLVFMLTTANKKIRSGALSSDRKAILEEIKAKNLGKAVMEKFGKNATQCKTPDLQAFLAENSAPAVQTKAPKAEPKVEAPAVEAAPITGNTAVIISNAGSDRLKIVKVVKETINVGLKEAKDIVDGVPSRIQGLTEEVAAKFVSDLIGAGATASIEGQGATTTPVQAGPVVDVKARTILGKLLNLLVDEEDLYGDYSGLLDELQGDCGETQAVEAKVEQPAPKKEDEDKLSSSELNAMFGGWAQ